LFDIIPDIHGQLAKLDKLLQYLEWHQTPAGWRPPSPDRKIVFLGDYIDRGPENGAVIRKVRSLVDSGYAVALMGNHELNAIHFHTLDPETDEPLRLRSDKNYQQHRTFLQEFPIGQPETVEAIAWFKTLPVFFEADGLRAVHACWHNETIAALREMGISGRLSEDDLISAGREGHVLYEALDILLKGPDISLPDGSVFTDKDGHVRRQIRVNWWKTDAEGWKDIAMSVPIPDQLPAGPLPDDLPRFGYPGKAPPVVFGHYWPTGTPVLQAGNVLCLDYSAGSDGPLLGYRLTPEAEHFELDNIVAA
jgi:Calcineurin-like phosphoesterase